MLYFIRSVLMVVACILPQLAAASWYEPARGTAERSQIMNAIRPAIEWRLGAPVQFVVRELRSDGTHVFAILAPQRPGGAAIDINQTPLIREFGDDPYYYEEVGGIEVTVFMIKRGDQWGVVDYTIGSTDAWFATPYFCNTFVAVMPDYCRE